MVHRGDGGHVATHEVGGETGLAHEAEGGGVALRYAVAHHARGQPNKQAEAEGEHSGYGQPYLLYHRSLFPVGELEEFLALAYFVQTEYGEQRHGKFGYDEG